MTDLESIRREYADQIREVLWRQCHVRLSDALRSAFARIRREDFLGAGPWLIRGAATKQWGRPRCSRCATARAES